MFLMYRLSLLSIGVRLSSYLFILPVGLRLVSARYDYCKLKTHIAEVPVINDRKRTLD